MLTLYDGEIHELENDQFNNYRRIIFKKHNIKIPADDILLNRRDSSNRTDREMTIPMIKDKVLNYDKRIDVVKSRIKGIFYKTTNDSLFPKSLHQGSNILKDVKMKLIGNSNERHKNLIETNNHPDLLILDKEKILLQHITFRKNKWDDEIGDNNINDFLSLTSSISDNKVALILNAHTMNNECQNALLKSLEEPSSNSYIIMTTNRKNALLDTIYSRCQVYNIPSLNSIQTDTWLGAGTYIVLR